MNTSNTITAESWKPQLLEFFKKGGVSMVEIMRLPESGGDRDLLLGENPSILIWHSMSPELVQALSELLRDQLISVRQTSVLIYAIDGTMLRLPIAKSVKRQYKNLHWMPATFNLA
jgi:hypothetical protein